jgi:hypothetical protein
VRSTRVEPRRSKTVGLKELLAVVMGVRTADALAERSATKQYIATMNDEVRRMEWCMEHRTVLRDYQKEKARPAALAHASAAWRQVEPVDRVRPDLRKTLPDGGQEVGASRTPDDMCDDVVLLYAAMLADGDVGRYVRSLAVPGEEPEQTDAHRNSVQRFAEGIYHMTVVATTDEARRASFPIYNEWVQQLTQRYGVDAVAYIMAAYNSEALTYGAMWLIRANLGKASYFGDAPHFDSIPAFDATALGWEAAEATFSSQDWATVLQRGAQYDAEHPELQRAFPASRWGR